MEKKQNNIPNIFKMNTVVYYLRFFLKNISKTRKYKVLEQEQERLSEILQNRNQRDNTLFFCFDTIDGLSVCISISDIQAVQMLFEIDTENILSNNCIFNQDLSLMLRGWTKEFPIEIEDASEIYDLIYSLDSVSSDDSEFLQITDCNGELNIFNANEVVYIEVATHILVDDREFYDEEVL